MAQKLSNLPIGAKIKFGKHSIASEAAKAIIWVVADKNHSGYPSDSVSLITEKVIDIRVYDAVETGQAYGNINYELSNINQWLNSSASAGNWYSATHSTDAPPNYSTRPGFLYNFTSDEKSAILPTTITVQTYTDVSRKITVQTFLPSEREVLGTSEVTNDGSTRLAYFASNTKNCTATSQVMSYSSNAPQTATSLMMYFTRNTTSYDIRTIAESAYDGSQYPNATYVGMRPVVNLNSFTKVSDTTDTDGCYTFIANKPTSIDGSNTDLGTKENGFLYAYKITDGDDSGVTVTEYIDNVPIRTHSATPGVSYNAEITEETWFKLANGKHTLKIVATDGFSSATRTITFTRKIEKIVVQRTTPITATKMPTQIIVTLVKNIPYNALLRVEVCNNGFDATPTWETLEASSISSGLAHTFSNKVNTAGKWGVNIRVTVERNGGEGACYISEIGGNFE